uniref:Jupiter microtubule associated homolog 2 n=1 Tax=Lepisosteus oculatus TaxID=7918 RepID=W5M283_LEPOC|nr:PREDICTED: hematological and neurological expressed 1-like protein [Lepisosteus oculatus]
MTSTNMFQGLESSGKPSSRVLRPPGGGSSDLFGVSENTSQATKPHKMASNIFGPPDEAQSGPKRTNPPGGKSSGIFGESETARHQQRHVPPGGKSSNIFGDPVSSTAVRGHPNKPKDTNIFEDGDSNQEPESPQPKAEVPEERPKEQEKENGKEEEEEKEEAAAPQPPSEEAALQASVDDHEPRLGPRPRSHNKVIHPPGGKSSVAFY